MRERRLFIFLNVAALVAMLFLVSRFPPLPVYDPRYFPTPAPFIPTATPDPNMIRTATAVVKQATRAVAQTATSAAQTATPEHQVACAWVWNTEARPDYTDRIQKAFNEQGRTDVTVQALYYGEDCIDPTTNERIRFAARQTDYHLTVRVQDIPDANTLPYSLMNILSVMRPFLTNDENAVPPGEITFAFYPSDGAQPYIVRADSSSVLLAFENNYDAFGMYALVATVMPS